MSLTTGTGCIIRDGGGPDGGGAFAGAGTLLVRAAGALLVTVVTAASFSLAVSSFCLVRLISSMTASRLSKEPYPAAGWPGPPSN